MSGWCLVRPQVNGSWAPLTFMDSTPSCDWSGSSDRAEASIYGEAPPQDVIQRMDAIDVRSARRAGFSGRE